MSDFDYSDVDFEAKIRDCSEISPELTENNSILIKDLPLSDAVKKKLYVYVDYCNRSNNPAICNCSLIGCPETLSKTISQAVSNEMGVHGVIVDASSIDKPGDLAALVTNLNPGDYLTILNIQRMNSQVRTPCARSNGE